MKNLSNKCMFHAPCVCMYCKKTYGVKPGFKSTIPTHGICINCFKVELIKIKKES